MEMKKKKKKMQFRVNLTKNAPGMQGTFSTARRHDRHQGSGKRPLPVRRNFTRGFQVTWYNRSISSSSMTPWNTFRVSSAPLLPSGAHPSLFLINSLKTSVKCIAVSQSENFNQHREMRASDVQPNRGASRADIQNVFFLDIRQARRRQQRRSAASPGPRKKKKKQPPSISNTRRVLARVLPEMQHFRHLLAISDSSTFGSSCASPAQQLVDARCGFSF